MDGPRCLLHVINIQTMWRAYRGNTCVCVCVMCVSECVCRPVCMYVGVSEDVYWSVCLRGINLRKFSLTSANQGHSGG